MAEEDGWRQLGRWGRARPVSGDEDKENNKRQRVDNGQDAPPRVYVSISGRGFAKHEITCTAQKSKLFTNSDSTENYCETLPCMTRLGTTIVPRYEFMLFLNSTPNPMRV